MVTTSSTRVEGHGQFVDYIEHLTMALPHMNRNTLRVTIHIGGHDFQSEGTIDRWNGQNWHNVARISGAALTTDLKVGYLFRPNYTTLDKADFFLADRNRLVTLAEEIL